MSELVYIGVTCPRCAGSRYYIQNYGGVDYKVCVECGRFSAIEDDDNLEPEE